MPKAYLIAGVDVHDPDAFAKYGGRFLVRGGKITKGKLGPLVATGRK